MTVSSLVAEKIAFPRGAVRIGAIVAFAVLWLAIVWGAGRATLPAQILAGVSIMVVLALALTTLGWVEASAFAIACLAITFAFENLGVLTGFPFGHYAFLVEPTLPHVGAIPVIVGLLYVGMGYPSWVIANLLFDGSVRRPSTLPQLVGVPLIAAFAMVQWDVVMDPAGSTLARAWVWYDGGGYFGVPMTNFLGWFLVTYIYFQAFSLFLYARRTLVPIPGRSRALLAAPVLLYLAAGLCHLPPLFDPDSRLVDASGKVWSASDLRETTAIVMLFTMLPTSMLALLRIAQIRKPGTECESG
jgi:uncharacterized membrane protein